MGARSWHCSRHIASAPPELLPNRADLCSARRQLPDTAGAARVGRGVARF
jgi:hypothetical protein